MEIPAGLNIENESAAQTLPADNVNQRRVWMLRIGTYLLGLFILALAVSISVRSNLGVSPVSSVPFVFSRIFHVEFGNMTIIEFSAYVVIQWIILRKDFRWIQLLQIVCAMIFGKFVSLTSVLISWWTPNSYLEQLGMIALATVLIAIGIKLYLLADLIPQAADGLVQVISKKRGWKLANVKNVFDICSITLAASVSLLVTGEIIGLREGTVIMALGVGRVLALINWLDRDRLYRVVYGTTKMQDQTPKAAV